MVAGTPTHPAAPRVEGHEESIVSWEMGPAGIGGGPRPASARAGALQAAGRPVPADLDAGDWWYRARFDGGRATGRGPTVLALDGLATVADVYLNGEHVLSGESMFAEHRLDVTHLLSEDNV